MLINKLSKKRPDFEDAKNNLEIAKELEKQQKQQQNSQNNNNKDQQDQQDQQNQNEQAKRSAPKRT